ncbi:MAG TPA: rRNA adenine N-6-methyltransferase family protein, partial [Methylomirabilota bacterium]|nr:rRNA adenine N-6-methyltransferase family protein [Methylomirabilota bacterium]
MIDPADPDQLSSLLRRHRIDLKHSLGQNFIVDPVIRDRIADAAQVREDDDVLEVGAGAGALTIALAKQCRRLVAVELDQRFIPVLREVTSVLANVEIVE